MDNLKTRGIIDNLGSCFPGTSDNFSDVLVICCDGQISTHKLVLASISQMLYTEFKVNIWDEIVYISLPDTNVRDITNYLLCAYNGKSLTEFTTLNQLIGCLYEEENIKIDGEPSVIKEERIEIVDVHSILDFENHEDEVNNQDEVESNAKPILIPVKAKKQRGLKKKIWEHFEEVSEQNSKISFACHHCSIKFLKTEAKFASLR